MNPAQLTIVVPVYNREHLVERTLNSIKAQTYRPLNLIVVDNNSTDSTLSTILQWCSANNSEDFSVTVAMEPIPGAAAARNAGLRMVNTTWTMFFDSDDVMLPSHVSRIMNAIDNSPDVDLVGWDVFISFPDGSNSVKKFPEHTTLYNCIMDGTLSTQRYMAKTAIFNMVGGWNNSVRVWDDIELGSRLLQFPAIKIGRLLGEPRVIIFARDDSITGPTFSSRAKGCEHALCIMEKVIPPHLNYIVQLKRAILAANYYKEKNAKMSRRLYIESLSNTNSLWNRWLMKAAYHYTRLGGRGAAKLLRRYFKDEPQTDKKI